MEALSPYRGRIVYGVGALLALAGCDSRHAEEAALDVAVVTARPSARMSSPATIARSTPRPTPTATPSPAPRTVVMQPRRSFVDPPLPPELLDDGGLDPLPPSPTR